MKEDAPSPVLKWGFAVDSSGHSMTEAADQVCLGESIKRKLESDILLDRLHNNRVRERKRTLLLRDLEERKVILLEDLEHLNGQYTKVRLQLEELSGETEDVLAMGRHNIARHLGFEDSEHRDRFELNAQKMIDIKRQKLETMRTALSAERQKLSKLIVAKEQELTNLHHKIRAVYQIIDDKNVRLALNAKRDSRDHLIALLGKDFFAGLDRDKIHPWATFLRKHALQDFPRKQKIRRDVLKDIALQSIQEKNHVKLANQAVDYAEVVEDLNRINPSQFYFYAGDSCDQLERMHQPDENCDEGHISNERDTQRKPMSVLESHTSSEQGLMGDIETERILPDEGGSSSQLRESRSIASSGSTEPEAPEDSSLPGVMRIPKARRDEDVDALDISAGRPIHCGTVAGKLRDVCVGAAGIQSASTLSSGKSFKNRMRALIVQEQTGDASISKSDEYDGQNFQVYFEDLQDILAEFVSPTINVSTGDTYPEEARVETGTSHSIIANLESEGVTLMPTTDTAKVSNAESRRDEEQGEKIYSEAKRKDVIDLAKGRRCSTSGPTAELLSPVLSFPQKTASNYVERHTCGHETRTAPSWKERASHTESQVSCTNVYSDFSDVGKVAPLFYDDTLGTRIPSESEAEYTEDFHERRLQSAEKLAFWNEKVATLENQIQEKNELLLRIMQEQGSLKSKQKKDCEDLTTASASLARDRLVGKFKPDISQSVQDVLSGDWINERTDNVGDRVRKEFIELREDLEELEEQEKSSKLRGLLAELTELKKDPAFRGYYRDTFGFGFELPSQDQLQKMHELFEKEYLENAYFTEAQELKEKLKRKVHAIVTEPRKKNFYMYYPEQPDCTSKSYEFSSDARKKSLSPWTRPEGERSNESISIDNDVKPKPETALQKPPRRIDILEQAFMEDVKTGQGGSFILPGRLAFRQMKRCFS